MSSKYRVYNALVAKRALIVFASIILTLVGSLAVIQQNRQSREEVAAATKNNYLYDASIVSPSNGEQVLVSEGVDLLVTIKGKESVEKLPSPEEIEFFNEDDFIGHSEERMEVESEVCRKDNQECVIANYVFKWTAEDEVFPLVAGKYTDLHVIVTTEGGRTVGSSEPVQLIVQTEVDPENAPSEGLLGQ
jgi:hypothetical protein